MIGQLRLPIGDADADFVHWKNSASSHTQLCGTNDGNSQSSIDVSIYLGIGLLPSFARKLGR